MTQGYLSVLALVDIISVYKKIIICAISQTQQRKEALQTSARWQIYWADFGQR